MDHGRTALVVPGFEAVLNGGAVVLTPATPQGVVSHHTGGAVSVHTARLDRHLRHLQKKEQVYLKLLSNVRHWFRNEKVGWIRLDEVTENGDRTISLSLKVLVLF